MLRKIALAYSGGLDTSIIVPWLREHYDARDHLRRRRHRAGRRARWRSRQGDRLRRRRVLRRRPARGVRHATSSSPRSAPARSTTASTSSAPPWRARSSPSARSRSRAQVGADALAHGCTGKGNDQVRFELTYAAFAPDLPVIAPWREWDIRSREDAHRLRRGARHSRSSATRDKIYSRDAQSLAPLARGRNSRGSERRRRRPICFMLTTDPAKRAGHAGRRRHRLRARHAGLGQRHRRSARSTSSTKLNTIGGKHGVGRIDLVEDRLVGMKSRGIYETPGGTLLYAAHSELEQLVLDRRTLAAKDLIAPRYADLVYEGRWWTTEREAYDAFVNVTQERVTGTVTLRLFKGIGHGRRAARASTRCTTSASSRSAKTTSTSRATRPASFASSRCRRACARSRIRSCDARRRRSAADATPPTERVRRAERWQIA